MNPLQGLFARRVMPFLWSGIAALTLSAGVAQAYTETGETKGGDVDFLQLMAPSLGSRTLGVGDLHWGWSDRVYRHPRIWINVTGGQPDGEGFVLSSLNQIMIGDVTATSSIRRVWLTGVPGLAESGAPRIIASATAIGNMSAINVCMLGNCGVEGDEPDPEAQDDGQSDGNPELTVTSVVDGSDGDVTPDVVVTDTRPQSVVSDDEDDVTEETTDESQAAEATKDEDEDELNFKLVMIPSFGSGIGPADWWFPGLGGLHAFVAPSVPLLSRVLAERNQLVIGNVVATATVDMVTTELAEAADVGEVELVADEPAVPPLPDISLNAVAVGNSSTMTSDIGGLAIDRQIVIGSVDGSIDMPSSFGGKSDAGTMSSALLTMMSDGMIEKAQITAEVTAEDYDGVLSQFNATAIANNSTADADPTIETDGLVVVDLLQFSYGNVIAKSSKGPADITGELYFSSVATAVGNMTDFKLGNPFN